MPARFADYGVTYFLQQKMRICQKSYTCINCRKILWNYRSLNIYLTAQIQAFGSQDKIYPVLFFISRFNGKTRSRINSAKTLPGAAVFLTEFYHDKP